MSMPSISEVISVAQFLKQVIQDAIEQSLKFSKNLKCLFNQKFVYLTFESTYHRLKRKCSKSDSTIVNSCE